MSNIPKPTDEELFREWMENPQTCGIITKMFIKGPVAELIEYFRQQDIPIIKLLEAPYTDDVLLVLTPEIGTAISEAIRRSTW